MTDDDIDEGLKKKWIEVLNPNNSELINQQMNRFANLTEIERNVSHILRYQGKFNFVMGRYEQALANLNRGETYYMIKKYEESLADLNKLLEINTNDMWALKAHEEVIRE